MKIDVIVGLQWGDEGKGKMIDVLCKNYDIVARYQGGPNAGHTIHLHDKVVVLHTLPSGICRTHCINIIGNGVVIDPVILRKEIKKVSKTLGLDEAGICKRLYISSKASLILPTHPLIDQWQEHNKGKHKIGSTLKGIGPCYTDKVARNAMLVGQIFDKNFDTILENKIVQHLKLIGKQNEVIDIAEWKDALEWMKTLQVTNTEIFINNQIQQGKRVLAEGAQGAMLDVNFGTYPYVTSSSTTAAGVCQGLGVAPQLIGRIFGVCKAYTTRVGEGPFPSEISDNVGMYLQKNGNEYGSTTGRARRCGWLDIPLLKYAIMINGVTHLMLMKVDVLSGLPEVKVASHYEYKGEQYFIGHTERLFLYEAKLYYDTLGCWKSESNFNFNNQDYRDFITYIETKTQVSISHVSYGPHRTEVVEREFF